MYVCICHAVTDKRIHRAVQEGARSVRDLRDELQVTTQCGRCATCVKDCLRSALAEKQPQCSASYRPVLHHALEGSL
jgi:bacterioferritin-associated ferredoxin